METIQSHRNPLIKQVLRLRKSSERRKTGRFLIDGDQEIQHAVNAGWVIEKVLLADPRSLPFLAPNLKQLVSGEILERISYGQRAADNVAIGVTPEFALSTVKWSDSPLVLVLDRTEKPGNLGACLRTAAAAGADLVVLTDPICELVNPNTIRASRGALFTMQVAVCQPNELIRRCADLRIPIYTAQLGGGASLWECRLESGCAVVFGNEASGLGEPWAKVGISFEIPMNGTPDSLNLSISAAVTLYEAKRQRTIV